MEEGGSVFPARAAVVGAVYSAETLRAAFFLGLSPVAPDLIELRVDGFAADPAALDALAAAPPRPLIVTVRRPDEGGAGALTDASRRALYRRFLPTAAYIDMEVRSLRALADVADAARERRVRLIASFHDFHSTPSLARLRTLAARAFDAGADIFKAAATLERPGDLAVLFDLLGAETRLPLAVMGMGRLGRASRPALAAAGSVLNYGYLGALAQVSGQWPVAKLRERIDELLPPPAPAGAA
jgi:3-dehydroquinate dehydratase-1